MYFLGGRDLCDSPSEDANYGDDMVPDCNNIESSDSDVSSSSEGEEHWDIDIEEVIKDLESDTGSECSVTHGMLHVILLFLSLWASFYGISARALDHLITFLHHVFSTLTTASVTTLATVFPSSLYLV